MAIRTGNWHLRCSAVFRIAPLAFAFSRRKYEEVVAEAITDDYLLPPHVRTLFENGEWTVSVLGRDACSQALDEAHESNINRFLKRDVGRPTLERMRDKAGFTTYCSDTLTAITRYLSYHSKAGRLPTTRKSHEPARVGKVMTLFRDVKAHWNEEAPLRRASGAGIGTHSEDLKEQTSDDLLSYAEVGKRRLTQYMLQYHFWPPIQMQAPRDRRKLATFTPPPSMSRAMRSARRELVGVVSALHKRISSLRAYLPMSTLPLAICTSTGEKRDHDKAEMYGALKSTLGGTADDSILCESSCSFENSARLAAVEAGEEHEGGDMSSTGHAVIIDALRIVHEGPSPSHQQYDDWYTDICRRVHARFKAGATSVCWIADNPEYLSPQRGIVHKSRAEKAGVQDSSTAPPAPSPVSSLESLAFGTAIRDQQWKKILNQQIAAKLAQYCTAHLRTGQTIVIDAGLEEAPTVVTKHAGVESGSIGSRLGMKHDKGEADYSIWLYVNRCWEEQVLVLARDTDIWMYGLALYDLGALGSKHVQVERKRGQPVIDVPKAVTAIHSSEKYNRWSQPCVTLLFLYLQSGSDYVSKWYFLGHKTWLNHLIQNADFIMSDGPASSDQMLPGLFNISRPSHSDTQHADLSYSEDKMLRFYACPFFQRGKDNIVNTGIKDIQGLWQQMKIHSTQRTDALQKHFRDILFRDPGDIILVGGEEFTAEDACTVIRRMVFAKSADDAMNLPEKACLQQHTLRAVWGMRMVLESTVESTSQVRNAASQYGWEYDSAGGLQYCWGHPPSSTSANPPASGSMASVPPAGNRSSVRAARPNPPARKPCGCAGGRSGECCKTRQCACSKSCLPCMPECKCGGGQACYNPHTHGRTCAACPPSTTTLADIIPDQAPEEVPSEERNLENSSPRASDDILESGDLNFHEAMEKQLLIERQPQEEDQEQRQDTVLLSDEEDEVEAVLYGKLAPTTQQTTAE